MYIINKETSRIEKIESTTFKQLGFKERECLQEWIENNPSCLNEDLLIIQKEFDGFYVAGDYIRIELSIHGKTQEENKAIFDAFESRKDKIEAAFGNPLEWERLSEKRISRIKYQLSGVSVFNEEDWNKMFELMVQYVPKFESAFKVPIQLLSRK